MTYFTDLSPYTYFSTDTQVGLAPLNIGWLDPAMPYSRGVTSQAFHRRLLRFCASEAVVHQCYGYHFCEFCNNGVVVVKVQLGDEELWLGNGEIRVIGGSTIYAAPTLIYHYVVAHQYQPPAEFITAVLTSPLPGSPEHTALLRKIDGSNNPQQSPTKPSRSGVPPDPRPGDQKSARITEINQLIQTARAQVETFQRMIALVQGTQPVSDAEDAELYQAAQDWYRGNVESLQQILEHARNAIPPLEQELEELARSL